jgi:hypothetical protein
MRGDTPGLEGPIQGGVLPGFLEGHASTAPLLG